MTQPRPVTIAGRQVRVAPPPAQFTVALPTPHRFRRCHWVTVSARRIPAVPQTQLLQSCALGCGRHRTRILGGHWQPRDLVHPATLPPVELDGRDLARAARQ